MESSTSCSRTPAETLDCVRHRLSLDTERTPHSPARPYWAQQTAQYDQNDENDRSGSSLSAQIGRDLGYARSAVVAALLEADIRQRGARLPDCPKGQVAFGQRVQGGRIVSHLSELRVIETLKVMRRGDSSYTEN